jgi:hypothetical protein
VATPRAAERMDPAVSAAMSAAMTTLSGEKRDAAASLVAARENHARSLA